jgi:hypothetical protein
VPQFCRTFGISALKEASSVTLVSAARASASRLAKSFSNSALFSQIAGRASVFSAPFVLSANKGGKALAFCDMPFMAAWACARLKGVCSRIIPPRTRLCAPNSFIRPWRCSTRLLWAIAADRPSVINPTHNSDRFIQFPLSQTFTKPIPTRGHGK